MIRKLTQKDNDDVLALVSPEASINLFIIGDLEMYGYDSDFQELWGDFDENQRLRGILLRYYDFFIVYGLAGYDAKGFAAEIERHETCDAISGEQGVLNALSQHLKGNFTNRDAYFAECRKDTLALNFNKDLLPIIKIATPKEAGMLAELMCAIPEFTVNDAQKEQVRVAKTIEDGAGRYYFIQEGEKAISIVATAAENSNSAMLVGVCTAPEHRLKGYTTTLMSSLLRDLLEEKASVCLFYDNPKAGAIYKRNGFVDIGMWTMLTPSEA